VTERFSTGNPRLDSILGGGLVRNSITLVVGAPGSGKTLLAEQCLFENRSADQPGLYLSTVSEPLEKLLRYGQSLGFFDPHAIGRSVFYEELGSVLDRDGLPGVSERIDQLLKQHRPGIVVIDSFKALNAFAGSDEAFRRFLHDLTGRLTAVAVSSLWIGEYAASDAYDSPEFAVADSVINLATKRTGQRTIRYLDVIKMRGSAFSPGEHVYRLSNNGLIVFPRLADPRDPAPFVAGTARVSTGIPALDEALGDGYWAGSATLVAGPSGAGKTLLGLHFLYAGAERDEPGVLLTLQESRPQLARIIEGFGWSMPHPAVTVLDRSPVDVYMDELVYELLDCVDETNARRVVLDSLTDLLATSDDETRFREFTYSLIQRLARKGVSVMFTLESPELFRISRLGELGMSHISDNVVLLQHLHDGSQMARALTVLKTRGSSHEARVRQFRIGAEGITLGDPIDLQLLLR
jgi:circadian clock protein KaiC